MIIEGTAKNGSSLQFPPMFNLILIKAAVKAATGVSVTLDELRILLVEEGLLSKAEAIAAKGYTDYASLFDLEEFSRDTEMVLDAGEGLPE